MFRKCPFEGAGNYEIPALLVGSYQLKFTNEGFKPLVMDDIELTVPGSCTPGPSNWLRLDERQIRLASETRPFPGHR
jgi:hypothetical protein